MSGEPVLQARALWILAQIGGSQVVEKFLGNEDDQKLQVVAYRALRHADPKGTLTRAKQYADSKNLHLLREIAVGLRGVPFQDCRSILEKLIDGYDGRNRYYLESLGVAFHGKENQVYDEIISPQIQNLLIGGGKQRTLPGVSIQQKQFKIWMSVSVHRIPRWMNSVFLPWLLPVFEMMRKGRNGENA